MVGARHISSSFFVREDKVHAKRPRFERHDHQLHDYPGGNPSCGSLSSRARVRLQFAAAGNRGSTIGQDTPDTLPTFHERLRSPQQPNMAGHVFRHINDAQPPARSRAIRLVSVDVGKADVGKLGVVVGHAQQIPAAGAHTTINVQLVM